MITVKTEQYEFVHGHKPKGNGRWLLEIEYTGRNWETQKETIARNMPYSSAVASARKYARQELKTEIATITVLS